MRAQAALEFLVTYAWAIALITVSLSWIAYMGFTNPTDFAGDDCRVSGEFGCEDAKLSAPSEVTASEASFVLRNLQPEKISVQEVTVEYDSQSVVCSRIQNLDGSDVTFVRSGEEFEVLCDDNTLQLPEGENAKVSFTIKYNKSAGFPREATGEITGLVDDTQTSTAVCDDGAIDPGEECDEGADNGVACNPGYGSSCEYCSSSCELVTVQGGFCGDNDLNVYQEQCDDGADGDDLDGCTDVCEYTPCDSALVGAEGGCTNTEDDSSIEVPQDAGTEWCKIQNDYEQLAHCVSCGKGYQWDSSIYECVEIPPPCSDECSPEGSVRCFDPSREQYCYDVDSDDCLEWTNPQFCYAGEGTCVEGSGCP